MLIVQNIYFNADTHYENQSILHSKDSVFTRSSVDGDNQWKINYVMCYLNVLGNALK